jgi:hypothetical protein
MGFSTDTAWLPTGERKEDVSRLISKVLRVLHLKLRMAFKAFSRDDELKHAISLLSGGMRHLPSSFRSNLTMPLHPAQTHSVGP